MRFMIEFLREDLGFEKYYDKSLTVAGNAYLFMGVSPKGMKCLAVVLKKKAGREIFEKFSGETKSCGDYYVKICPLTHENASSLRSVCAFARPSAAGPKTAFGFGDRLGNATPGHAAAAARFNVFPVFAQQSAREMSRTGKSPSEVIDSAAWGVFQANYKRGYGADADHLKTLEDVKAAAGAGFTMFTIDPSDYIAEDADRLSRGELDERFNALFESQKQRNALLDFYLNFSLGKLGITFSYSDIKREAVTHLPAIRRIREFYDYLVGVKGGEAFDFEVSIDETGIPTTGKAHIFIITQLKENGVNITSLAPKFPGEFQKGIDFLGDQGELRKALKLHRAIAMEYGNYKLSIHSGSDKFSIFELIGKSTHKQFHEKTSGTSYVEALRIVAAKAPKLYREIHEFALGRFEEERRSYSVAPGGLNIPDLAYVPDEGLEELLDGGDCRQLIHVTYGPVLQERAHSGEYAFRDRILNVLQKYEEEYCSLLEKHFVKHLKGFCLKERP